MDIHNSIMDIHNSIMDIHNSIMDIHNSIMDIHNYRVYALLAFHISLTSERVIFGHRGDAYDENCSYCDLISFMSIFAQCFLLPLLHIKFNSSVTINCLSSCGTPFGTRTSTTVVKRIPRCFSLWPHLIMSIEWWQCLCLRKRSLIRKLPCYTRVDGRGRKPGLPGNRVCDFIYSHCNAIVREIITKSVVMNQQNPV